MKLPPETSKKKFGWIFFVNFINLQKGPGVQQKNSFKFKNKLYDFSNQADNNLLNHIEVLASYIQNNSPPGGSSKAEASKGPIQRKLRMIIQ